MKWDEKPDAKYLAQFFKAYVLQTEQIDSIRSLCLTSPLVVKKETESESSTDVPYNSSDEEQPMEI
jgi:hypothetical protein